MRRTPPEAAKPARGWFALGVLALIAAGGYAFAPALAGTWVWDDHSEIIDNALLEDPAALGRIWRGSGTTDYFPLKTSLQWLQWRAWGDNPFPYHLTNIALHLFSAMLVWRLLRKLGCMPLAGWLGGLAFAVHPLAVESVAWIAEFKNAVSLPPLLLATLAYVDFIEGGRRRDYAWALGWFVVAALCKTSVVMLPPILLMYTWWRRRGLTMSLALAAAPFFAVSAILGGVTIWFQHARAIGAWDIAPGGALERIGRAGAAIGFYLGKSIVPVGLLPVYPRSLPGDSPWWQALCWVALLALVGWGWRRRERWGGPVLVAFGWFALHLAPVVGLVAMAFMHFAWVADHFAYLSLIGVVGLAAAGLTRAWSAWPETRAPLVVACGLVLLLAALATRRHAARFANEETLWRYTLARNPAAWVGHNNLAVALGRQKRFEEALAHTRRALELWPDYADAHLNAANYFAQLGRVDEAIASAQRAEAAGAGSAEMYSNTGAALLRAGRAPEAVEWYQRGLQRDATHAPSNKGYGVALLLVGRAAAAIEYFERGLQSAPDPETHTNCGVALASLGRHADAVRHYEAALRLAPDSGEARYNYGIALARMGQPAAAQPHLEASVRHSPNRAEAHFNLAEVLLAQGRRAEAAAAYRAALRLRPDLSAAAQRLQQLERDAGTAP